MTYKKALITALFPLALSAIHGTVQLRGGYFYPESRLVQEMYHNGGVEGEFEASVQALECLGFFANGSIFRRSGHSVGLASKSSMQLYPLSLGFKSYTPLGGDWQIYLGGAPSYTWARFHNHSHYVKETVHTGNFGFVIKGGFLWNFAGRDFLDFFVDYYYTKLPGTHSVGTKPTSTNIGGFRTGIGLGCKY